MRVKLFLATLISITLLIAACADKNLRQGRILLKQSPPDYEAAIEQFQKSISSNPQNADAYYYLGKVYSEMEKYEEMDEAFNKAVEFNPIRKEEIDVIREKKWDAVFNKGLNDVEKEDFNEALRKFEICMTVDPSKYESFSNAGFVATKLDLDQKAYDYNKKAFEMKSDNYDNVRNFAATCYRQEKYDEALEVYRQARKLKPNDPNIPIRIGQIYEKKEKLEDAVITYNEALEIDAGNSNLWFNIGVLYFQKLDDLRNAENAFAQARYFNPDDFDAGFNQILVLLKMKDFKKAAAIIHELEEKNPDNCDIYDLMTTIYAELNDKKMVNQAIAKAKKCRGE